MTFKAAESLAEQIARHVGRQIVTGDLVEGERIQELRIAKELNVSRGSVREALLILERRHLINIYPRRGAVVAEMSAQQIKSLFEILALLLTVIARRAADSWRQTDVLIRSFTGFSPRRGYRRILRRLICFFSYGLSFCAKSLY